MKRIFRTMFACGVMIACSAYVSAQQDRRIVVGTGGVTGVYFPAGGAVCRLVNQRREEHGVRCSVESTNGSTQNIHMLLSGELDLGIAQKDRLHDFLQVNPANEIEQDGRGVVSLFALHSELLTFVVRADSDIKSLDDVVGSVINLGPLGSGQRGTAEALFKALGWYPGDFKKITSISPLEQSRALCSGKIDVMIYMVGHPNGAVQEVTTLCDSRLLEVTGDKVEAFVKTQSGEGLVVDSIAPGLYRGNKDRIHTLGVKAVLLATTDMSEDEAYSITKSVFERMNVFRVLHPALRELDEALMVDATQLVPMHKGAQRYFREAGMLP